jgi:hypothetical protein
LDDVIDLYGHYRLLTFDNDPATRGPTVEVAHEALLREWGRLRGWLESSQADVHMQRLLAAATAEWEEAGREASYLLLPVQPPHSYPIWLRLGRKRSHIKEKTAHVREIPSMAHSPRSA